jgi:diadenosine tetraphosphate (Ap4A) HIT family hydrolase
MDCFLCDSIQTKNHLVCENDYFTARFDAHPVTPGHLLIFPKEHITSLFNLSAPAWNSLQEIILEAKKHIESVNFAELYTVMKEEYSERKQAEQYIELVRTSPFIHQKPEGYTIGINDGEVAGQTVPHLHMHLIPRYTGDVSDPRGGVRMVIPKLGNYRTYGN